MKNLTRILAIVLPAGLIVASCEGPAGPAGKDFSESCGQCHNREVVEQKRAEYEHSKHFFGTAFEEATRTACAPCHSTKGFLYVSENQTPANNYVTDAATATFPGRLECQTCHNKIHTTYTYDDFRPFTWNKPVDMVMWSGTKTLDFAQETSDLCAKCHQPRPVTTAQGAAIDYNTLVSSPTANYTLSGISYRTGVHYGTQGAMNRGKGGVEFGTGYTADHPHNTGASCATCHMATAEGVTGGHSFTPNFNGCNVSGCHSDMNATNSRYVALTTQFDTQLSALAAKINAIGAGHDILQRDPADNQYHGYLDIFDRTANPTGFWGATGNPAFPTLTNKQFGAIINFQLLARDGSRGIHNPKYIIQLLKNTTDAL